VLRKTDFDAAYRFGRRFHDSHLSVTVRPNSLGHPRLGLAIAAKTIGNAVARNRLRRIIREKLDVYAGSGLLSNEAALAEFEPTRSEHSDSTQLDSTRPDSKRR